MAAIITEQFRKNSRKLLLGDINNNKYYIGIGQQSNWDEIRGQDFTFSAPYPAGTAGDETRVLEQLTGLFSINASNSDIVIPKNTIDANTNYKTYDPYDPTCFYESKNTSLLGVTAASFTITSGDRLYTEAPTVTISGGGATTNATATAVIAGGTGGTVIGITITNPGSGYTSAPTLVFSGGTMSNPGTTGPTAVGNANNFISIGPSDMKPCYVMSRSTVGAGDDIFLCLSKNDENNLAGSLAANTLGSNAANTYGLYSYNGYVWGYLGKYDKFNEINTSSFVAAGNDIADLETNNNVNNNIRNTTGGLIFGFKVINGGKGKYRFSTTLPTANGIIDAEVELRGLGLDGLPRLTEGTPQYPKVPVKITINGLKNSIEKIIIEDNVLIANANLLDWSAAKAVLVIPSNNIIPPPSPPCPCDDTYLEAVIIPKIAPAAGFGYAKLETLPSWYIGVFCDTSTATYVPAGTTYHQISIVKDPLNLANETLSDSFVNPLKYFTRNLQYKTTIPTTSGGVPIGAGWKINQLQDELMVNVGVISYIQKDDGVAALDSYRYYYYSDHTSGYFPLLLTGEIEFVSPDGSMTTSIIDGLALTNGREQSATNRQYKEKSGEVLFIDNRGTIIKEKGQNEELKLIIQL